MFVPLCWGLVLVVCGVERPVLGCITCFGSQELQKAIEAVILIKYWAVGTLDVPGGGQKMSAPAVLTTLSTADQGSLHLKNIKMSA